MFTSVNTTTPDKRAVKIDHRHEASKQKACSTDGITRVNEINYSIIFNRVLYYELLFSKNTNTRVAELQSAAAVELRGASHRVTD